MELFELTNEQYNELLNRKANDYRKLNCFVMLHTKSVCENDIDLAKAIEETKKKQFVQYEKKSNNTNEVVHDGPTTNIIVSKKRSFEAARAYQGKKVAVLNFANNHSVGGAPFSAGAQEESLCRISTLYPCLLNEKESFYKYHSDLYEKGELKKWGNDDLIYSPDIVVFKSDESAPKMLDKNDWYKVDVITSAAPVIDYWSDYPGSDFDWGMGGGLKRLRAVFEVAKKQGVEALILGAWGCGAYHNPPTAVAATFKILCDEYHFDTIEFAVFCREDETNYRIFNAILNEKNCGEKDNCSKTKE